MTEVSATQPDAVDGQTSGTPADLADRLATIDAADRDARWEAWDRANRHTPLSDLWGPANGEGLA